MRPSNEKVSLDQAAKLIAARDMRNRDSKRDAIDRTRKRIEGAVTKGCLKQSNDKTFSLADLIGWARDIWPNISFDDLPANASVQPIGFGARSAVGSVQVVAVVLPTTIDACHDEIKRLTSKSHADDCVIASLNHQIDELTPDAVRTRVRRKKAQEAASKRWRVEK